MSGNGGIGKKSESGKGSDGTARGRRNERRNNARGKEIENGRETETKTAGPENESETETGRRTEAGTRPPNAVDPGEGKKTSYHRFQSSTSELREKIIYSHQQLTKF